MIPNTQKPEVDINTALAKAINYKILHTAFKLQFQQVRTNIGLADTLIPSSFFT